MHIEGEARRVRIYIGESDQFEHRSLQDAIVEECRGKGIAGATVLRGIEGYGANSRIHTTKILDLSSDLPIVIEIVDRPERLEAFMPHLEEMVKDGLITIEPVQVVKYSHRKE